MAQSPALAATCSQEGRWKSRIYRFVEVSAKTGTTSRAPLWHKAERRHPPAHAKSRRGGIALSSVKVAFRGVDVARGPVEAAPAQRDLAPPLEGARPDPAKASPRVAEGQDSQDFFHPRSTLVPKFHLGTRLNLALALALGAP